VIQVDDDDDVISVQEFHDYFSLL